MKRTNKKNQKELKLGRRLALVRNTIRDLSADQLAQVNGGSLIDAGDCGGGALTKWPQVVEI